MQQFYAYSGPSYPPVHWSYPPGQPTLTVAPTGYLGTLDGFKAYANIEDNNADTTLRLLLAAESNNLERELDQSYRPQTWVQTEVCLRGFMKVEKWPVVSATVTYYDSDNGLQTWTDWTLRTYPWPAIVANYGAEIPATYQRLDAVSITLTCGGAIPPEVETLCYARVLEAFEVRQYSTDKAFSEVPTFERQTRLLRRGPYIR